MLPSHGVYSASSPVSFASGNSKEAITALAQRAAVLDELHKYRKWRNYLKGLYDVKRDQYKILVTGSALPIRRRLSARTLSLLETSSPAVCTLCRRPCVAQKFSLQGRTSNSSVQALRCC